MQNINEAVSAFLASKPVAVTGVFRTPKTYVNNNNVYRRLRERGYQVFEINPNTGPIESKGAGATGTRPSCAATRSPVSARAC